MSQISQHLSALASTDDDLIDDLQEDLEAFNLPRGLRVQVGRHKLRPLKAARSHDSDSQDQHWRVRAERADAAMAKRDRLEKAIR